jgi:hypothetical protein
MTALLPNPQQPQATTAGQPAIAPAARAFLTEVEEALAAAHTPTATSFRDPTPVPAIGTAPPVPQPGRPAMSQSAVNASTLMLSAGVASLPVGAATALVLWASGHANPEVIAWACAVPVSVAVPVLALSRLVKRAKDAVAAAPAEQHHHYNGPVTQDHRTYTSETRGVWASTRNQLPK